MRRDEASTEPFPLSGTIGDKYRVEGIVGVGGMGIVYSAVHLQLGERVAIKTLRPEMAARSHAVARFLREARAVIRLRGEHTVRVLDAGIIPNGTAYIVMELLDGTDFAAMLGGGRLPSRTAVDYVLQACTAIAEAHALGIIHRDLKPANLFLTRRADGSACVKVLDFGISKVIEEGTYDPLAETEPSSQPLIPCADGASPLGAARPAYGQALTSTRASLGSPRYMSPEQMSSARDVDARADVWGLGGILYELLSGAPPFDAEDPEALRAAVLEASPPDLSGVPRELAAITVQCLQKNRERRFASVALLARALVPFGSPATSESAALSVERILSGHGQRPETPVGSDGHASSFSFGATKDEDEAARPRRPPRRRAVGVIGAIVAFIMSGAVATIAVRVAREPRAVLPLTNAMADGAPEIVPLVVTPAPVTSVDPVAIATASATPPQASRPPRAFPNPNSGPHFIAVPMTARPRPARPTPPTPPVAPAPPASTTNPLAVQGGELFDVRK